MITDSISEVFCVFRVIIFFPRRTRINTDFYSVYSVSSVDYLFHTDGHGGMSASERGGYCLSSELKRNLDGGSLAVQRLNCCDYLSADVRQMLYGFSSVSNLFSICGLPYRVHRLPEERSIIITQE